MSRTRVVITLITIILCFTVHQVTCNTIDDSTTTVQVDIDAASAQQQVFTSSSNNTREAKIDTFIKWMIDNGAIFSKKIQLAPVAGMGFGIVVDEENGISPKETYLQIPYDKLVIGSDYLKSQKYINYVFADLDKQFGDDIKHKIILYLLHEKLVRGEKSFWKPYLDVLPKTFSVPAFFSPEELDILKGTTMYEGGLQDNRQMENAFNGISNRVFDRFPSHWPRDKVTLSEFKWATWIYNSRLFFIEGRQPREHLVPLADMINCEETNEGDAEFVTLDSSSKYAILQADRFFKKGQQITETYGKKSNADLLRFEGFIFDDEKNIVNDCIMIRLENEVARRNFDQIRSIFGFGSPPQFCMSVSMLQQNQWPSRDGSSFAYILYLKARAEGKQPNSRADLDKLGQSMNQQDYRATWKVLLEIVEAQLKANMSNEKVRSYILNGRNDALYTYNAKLAIKYVLFERKQLQKFVALLQQK